MVRLSRVFHPLSSSAPILLTTSSNNVVIRAGLRCNSCFLEDIGAARNINLRG